MWEQSFSLHLLQCRLRFVLSENLSGCFLYMYSQRSISPSAVMQRDHVKKFLIISSGVNMRM